MGLKAYPATKIHTQYFKNKNKIKYPLNVYKLLHSTNIKQVNKDLKVKHKCEYVLIYFENNVCPIANITVCIIAIVSTIV